MTLNIAYKSVRVRLQIDELTNYFNMRTLFQYFLLSVFISCLTCNMVWAWEGMDMPRLHVDGRYLKDPHGNIVTLHGFAQTFSPWFNEQGTQWTNYDVDGCLEYNKGILDGVMAAGWKMNFVRQHMDPYWSNAPGVSTDGEHDISAFSFERFKTYLDQVFVPMAEYAISKGLYVVMRPPGVCPEEIAVGDEYQEYLLKVWGYVAQHPILKNHPNIMFELANEPVRILGPDGAYGSGTQGHFDNLKTYFQAIVDTIRTHADNILWIPGLGWQSQYQGFVANPIEGQNIGYAIHVYPGWFNSGEGYAPFQEGWDKQIKPVADFAPVMVTEMDWAPEKYNASWGKGITGTAGGEGFGANFKKITDDSENVSWLFFTEPHRLKDFTGEPPGEGEDYTFLNDPQACPWPIYQWFEEYALQEYPRPEFSYQSHSDNGDGTYTNPVIFGDFPDPDVIRVGEVYYMVSTTMHIFPGATILKSYDLVNWQYCSNPLERIENTACFNLDGCDRYGKGQWATSLRYKEGTFYLLFTTLDEGSYLLTTTDPEGVWEKNKLESSFYDPGLFFDDDGKTYVAYGINEIRIAELDEDFNKVPGQDKLVYTATFRDGLEGSHMYKINGYYYIYATYGGWPAFQVALRSSDIFGPYEEKKLLEDDNIHQGALVETQTGEWWTMLFYDKGAYGRLPNLQPVTWVDGWPELGQDGQGVTTYRKPDVGREYPVTPLPTNDNFRAYQLGMQWGWNHNPDNSKWSLLERPGYLRLGTVDVVDSLHKAKNTLTQRILGYQHDLDHSYGTIKMEIGNMKEGDVAGIAIFQDPYAYIGIEVMDGEKTIVMYNDDVLHTGPVVSNEVVYLRAVTSFNSSKASFYYSQDNETYTKLGDDLSMQFHLSVFTGNKFCLFNYATQQTGGYVDIDWFSTEKTFAEDQFYDDSFVGYNEESLTLVDLEIDNTELFLLTGSISAISVKAIYADGRKEDISIGAEYTNHNPDVVQVSNGRVMAKVDGEALITVSYKGPLGHSMSKDINLVSSTFPLVSGLFDPKIYAEGTFDEVTKTLHTGQWGFGGWEYDGIDLSGYKTLVIRLGSENRADVQFKLFDGSSYWGSPASFAFENTREVVVSLHHTTKEDGTPLNPGHIYIAGFWSNGSNPFVIDTVFLSNSREYDPPTLLIMNTDGASLAELNEFSYLPEFSSSEPSASQVVVVSGYNLTEGVDMQVSENYEISLEETVGYVENMKLDPDNKGELEETQVYVRMKAGLSSGTYTGNLLLTSPGAFDNMVALSGTVEGEVTALKPLAEKNKKVVRVEYFTPLGRQVDSIETRSGLFIIREFFSDGTITVKKIFIMD